MCYNNKFSKWFAILTLYIILINETECAIEEIEATPTNSNGFFLGDISMPQFLVMCVIFLIIILLYAVGVVPIEVDLGYFFGTGSGSLLPRKLDNNEGNLIRIFYECSMQYVCDVDIWANRNTQKSLLEKFIAYFFKNPNSRFSHSTEFSGIGSCREMYPCPFDVQNAVGLRIPGSVNRTMSFIEDNEVDLLWDLIS
ncbi:UNVERIFIED_CONTAM: hypothetical protein RMT77_011568 [Armadillidium vulgare]